MTHIAVDLGHIRTGFAQALADQRDGSHGKPIAKGEGHTHHVHANLVGGKFCGAQMSHRHGEQQKANAQANLFHQRAGPHIADGIDALPLGEPAFDRTQVDEAVLAQHRCNAHPTGAHSAQHRGNGRAPHP